MTCDDCPGGTDWEDRAITAEAELAAAQAPSVEIVQALLESENEVDRLVAERDDLQRRLDARAIDLGRLTQTNVDQTKALEAERNALRAEVEEYKDHVADMSGEDDIAALVAERDQARHRVAGLEAACRKLMEPEPPTALYANAAARRMLRALLDGPATAHREAAS